MENQIGVSVCVFTFNYEKYLSQALDSVLVQKTSFLIEIVIGDDCSKDRTREIARQYQEKYPDRITLSFNEANIGGTRNWIRTMNRCRGKYIALLDGDDYFTDEHKLQKQYDALEKDPSFVLSFHSVEEKYDDITGADKIIRYDQEIYTLEDFLKNGWFVRTAATFFRNGILPAEPPAWVYDYPYRYDTILHVFLCMHGNAICLRDVMTVWRKHSKGISYVLLENKIRNSLAEIRLAKQLDSFTGRTHARAVKNYVSMSYSYLFINILKSKKRFNHIVLLVKSMFQMDFGLVFRTLQKKNSMSLKRLAWDSDFFGLEVYSVDLSPGAGAGELEDLGKKLRHENADLAYVFVQNPGDALHLLLTKAGAGLYDDKLTYAKTLSRQDDPVSGHIDTAQEGDEGQLLGLAWLAGHRSRFRMDPRLSHRFQDLYLIWLRNSLNGGFADKVFVYREENRVLGFVTCRINGSGEGSIGLIASAPDSQGKGIGGQLVLATDEYYRERNAGRSTVVTQRDNEQACRFYEKLGFSVFKKEHVYHWWFK